MTAIANLTSKDQPRVDYEIDIKNRGNAVSVKTLHSRKLLSDSLFSGSKELMIQHLNEIYYLRITKQNKLILTK